MPGRGRYASLSHRPGIPRRSRLARLRHRLRTGILTTCLAGFITLSATPASADVNSEINRFWNNLGTTSIFTGPTAFQGQAAGYYTGGSLRARSGSRVAQPGGIDIFSGSLSIISMDELTQLSSVIVRNAIGFAFNLALETLSPVLAETMKDLRAKMQAINQANINSCEAAEALVMGAWPQTQRASQAVCARLGVRPPGQLHRLCRLTAWPRRRHRIRHRHGRFLRQ